ncbi:MAG: DUF4105 domain-containing protein [Bacteroidia bacterium]
MNRYKIVLISFLFYFSIANAQQKLSESATISVITCAPGNLIYECFGHTAIRVQDPDQKGFDFVFNYGIFEFNKPNFELNFAKGFMEYKLGVQRFDGFTGVYTRDNRTITEQVLNLNQEKKQQFFDYLVWNEKPENRYYMYNYFDDNCATKVRVVIEDEVGLKVSYNTKFKENEGLTYRQLIHKYAHNNRWSQLGIDLCLGMSLDEVLEDREYDFLPDYLFETIKSAEFDGKPLVKEELEIHHGEPRESSSWFTHPILIFWIFIIALMALMTKTSEKTNKTIEAVFLGITGFIGAFLLFIWFGTNHTDAANNLNLLWAMPMNLLLIALPQDFKRKYYLFYGLLLAIMLLNWIWFPQSINNAFLPLVAFLCFRSFAGYFRLCD